MAEHTRHGGSVRSYASPTLFSAVVAVMLGDVVTTGIGLSLGLREGNPVVAAIIAELGLGGLVLLKLVTALVLLFLPAITTRSRQTFRAGTAVYVVVGLLVVVSNLVAIVSVAG